jgi:hypothetical protein
MKKFLIMLSVIALIASSGFASVTTNTKELSEGSYPGELTKGSLSGTKFFIGDLSTLANTATLEYSYNSLTNSSAYFSPMGTVVLKTDLGILGIDAGPNVFFHKDTIGLMYGTSLDSVNAGAKIDIGTNGYSYENKNLSSNDGYHTSTFSGTGNYFDKENDSSSIFDLQLGAAMKNGFDLCLGIATNSSNNNLQELSNAAGVKTEDINNVGSSYLFNLSGRTVIGDGFTTVLTGYLLKSADENKHLTFSNTGAKLTDTTEKNTNSYFGALILIGKDINPTDSLKIKLASGAIFSYFPEDNHIRIDNMSGVTTYDTGSKSSNVGFSVPLNLAVEAKLNETWAINAGASVTFLSTQNIISRNNALAAAENWLDYSTNGTFDVASTMNYSLGVTGKMGDITLDAYLNPEILLFGPNFISGSDLYKNSDVMAYSIALGYSWK